MVNRDLNVSVCLVRRRGRSGRFHGRPYWLMRAWGMVWFVAVGLIARCAGGSTRVPGKRCFLVRRRALLPG